MRSLILIVVGLVALWASYDFGCRFYPPGEGYSEQKRNEIISMFLLIVGLALIVLGLLNAGILT